MNQSRFAFHTSHASFLLAALFIAAIAALPLLAEPGLLNTRGGGDSPFLLQRLQQLETALLDGHFPVRWMPDANYGYGYPFYNFYAPLSIYITAIFRLFGFSYVRAIQLSQLLGFLVAAWGMFRLGQRWFKNEWAALLTAAAYTFAPFHLVNIYVRGDSLAEFWAMAFYPLVILAAEEMLRKPYSDDGQRLTAHNSRRPLALFALAYAALILSHNISALIFSPFLLLYILLHWHKQRTTTHEQRITVNGTRTTGYTRRAIPLSLLLALALSAWFFIPALAEKSLAQLGPVTEGYFHFSNHFLGREEMGLIQPGFLFDYGVDGRQAFSLGLMQIITTAAGLIILFITWQDGKTKEVPRLFIILTFMTAVFMLIPWSRLLWEYVPLLAFTQFPWRFLSVAAFASAFLVGGIGLLPRQQIIVPITILLLGLSALGGLKTDHLILTDADITAERLAQYEWFTGNIGSTVSAEYLPHTVSPRPYTSPWLNIGSRDLVQSLAGDPATISQEDRGATRQTWEVTTSEAATLMLPTMDWPTWQVEINGEVTEIRPSPGSGLVTVEVLAGSSALNLRLIRTTIRWLAELVSLIAFCITIWLFRPSRPSFSRLLPPLLALSLLALILHFLPQRTLPPNDLTWDFAQMGYLHHDVEGVLFEDGSRLRGYTYSQENLAPGEQMVVTIQVENPGSGEASLALATPAVNRFPFAPLLISQSQPLAEQMVFQLHIPANAPTGLYVPRLTLDEGRPLTPSGQSRGNLFLRPLRIIGPLETAMPGPAPLDAQAVQVHQQDETALEVQLSWLTRQTLSHNYNFSLRLLDGAGQKLAQYDNQPGYGFQPSSGWAKNLWINDWLTLPLPPELSGTAPYPLMIHLYQIGGERVLTRRLGDLVPQVDSLVFQPTVPVFTLPEEMAPLTAVFQQNGTPLIQSQGYNLTQTANVLKLTLYWESLASSPIDYTRFVHLLDPASGEVIAQHDAFPQNNSYPTSQWTPGEIITDPVQLNLTTVPPGEYQLRFGFYQNLGDSWPRLTAVDATGEPFPDNGVPLDVDRKS